MADRLVLDYNNMMAPRIGERGLPPEALDRAAETFVGVHAEVERRRAAGELAFFELPYEDRLVPQIRAFADGAGQSFDTIVVLGIGGSALGTIALHQALCRPFWNELDGEAREYFPRLYVLDNVDPTTIAPLLDRLDLRRTLFNVVSKSGTTAETMAQFLVVRERLIRELGPDGYRRHLIFTTDPEKGVLRRLAREEDIAALPIPPGVGGRFSVLSAVGLLPAALVGIDIEALLAGARDMDQRCRTHELADNPAGLFAALQYLAHTEKGAGIHVVMAYSDRLYACADWFRQLWAESLGKRLDTTGAEVHRGPTPIKALGATDQHSQVQLYVEGPFDKTVTFLAVDELPTDLPIPSAYPEIDELRYLGGHSLGELLRAEQVATASALAEHGRMNMTLRLPRLDAHALGELIMALQIATVYAGALYQVNPLDQPGVELGKVLTYGLLGRSGFQPPARPAPDGRWISA
ncbi:MAG: glucose-6-phosphate isomerase [bacterium]|jgi:glucose-6-phosphate isomerase|nr:MAG: glucose-6-phosphate isomerase [bacterium]